MSTFVVQVDKDQEVYGTIQDAIEKRGITAATVSLIGAVQQITVSVMPKDNALDDIVTDYDSPFEMTGTGEVVDGKVHVHGVFAGEGVIVAGHLHRAIVRDWFVRAYVTHNEGSS